MYIHIHNNTCVCACAIDRYMDVALIILTCLIAMVMNVTSFGLIGKTSATTFQVVRLYVYT